jgi:hypothetical protein
MPNLDKLPLSLKSNILSFERKLLFADTAVAVSSFFLAFAFPIALLFVSDRFLETHSAAPSIVNFVLGGESHFLDFALAYKQKKLFRTIPAHPEKNKAFGRPSARGS